MSITIEKVSSQVSISPQVTIDDLATLAELGVEVVVCNRPASEQAYDDIKKQAEAQGLEFIAIPFKPEELTQGKVDEFRQLLESAKRLHAYCRTGNRSKKLWQQATDQSVVTENASGTYDVVIVGAGSAGIATASGIAKRDSQLSIAIIDPSEDHYYQPGWTMVGGGIFDAPSTHKKTKSLIPDKVDWLKRSVVSFAPKDNSVKLDDDSVISYKQLVVAPGLKLNWGGIEGLNDALGKHGVTSNYRYDLAPYTWELVRGLKRGKAIFTQPPMPIKCAGAPQKALYLSADHWLKNSTLSDIDIEFYNSGGVLFGVPDYVPALEQYIEKYQVKLNFMQTLIKVDGPSQTAWFKNADGEVTETTFDLLHVCPPQGAPDFVRESELADQAGWLAVDQHTLQHVDFINIWGVGDVINSPNAKTMAAARKQAPVVAHNIVNQFSSNSSIVNYDGYGSCPLTVERGKIVLAEFGYGGKLIPTFPKWLNDGTKPTKLAWLLKASMLPTVYWHGMLKGREWFARPK
ncbi:MAG: bifunctional protein tyrosine phosphatase family protein/NAD(P)/FAD-dependent oxidoreductase [Arenicella sp.]|nr:bifunctional protein tyrosine phosphatase family protein/NAD(P)/FAD-dependent oxidoreductase [Arenicella sp.]